MLFSFWDNIREVQCLPVASLPAARKPWLIIAEAWRVWHCLIRGSMEPSLFPKTCGTNKPIPINEFSLLCMRPTDNKCFPSTLNQIPFSLVLIFLCKFWTPIEISDAICGLHLQRDPFSISIGKDSSRQEVNYAVSRKHTHEIYLCSWKAFKTKRWRLVVQVLITFNLNLFSL